MTSAPAPERQLREILTRGRTLGFLGPGSVEAHLAHAVGFAVAAEQYFGRPPATLVDLGSGAGVPGLVLAARWPATTTTLVESGRRRCTHLQQAIDELGLAERVAVLEERAELTARRPDLREQVELVTARSFAAPAATAEIAAGLVAEAGVLIVSEPPLTDPSRWPPEHLGALGFGPAHVDAIDGAHFAAFVKTGGVPEKFPRAPGRPAKRPLW